MCHLHVAASEVDTYSHSIDCLHRVSHSDVLPSSLQQNSLLHLEMEVFRGARVLDSLRSTHDGVGGLAEEERGLPVRVRPHLPRMLRKMESVCKLVSSGEAGGLEDERGENGAHVSIISPHAEDPAQRDVELRVSLHGEERVPLRREGPVHARVAVVVRLLRVRVGRRVLLRADEERRAAEGGREPLPEQRGRSCGAGGLAEHRAVLLLLNGRGDAVRLW